MRRRYDLRAAARAAVAATLVGVVVAAPAPASAQAAPVMTAATVSGPIASEPVGSASRNYPFGASVVDLVKHGYVEEEFFFSGVTGAGPYTSRMLVRRPADPKRYSGNVLAEWTNVSNLFDFDCYWARSAEQHMRTGDIYVAIDAQTEGVNNPQTGLKAWNPERYEPLSIPPSGTFVAEVGAYEIFDQALRSLRAPKGADPTGGLGVKHLFATGCSQSSATLLLYRLNLGLLNDGVDGYLSAILSTNTTEYPGETVYPSPGGTVDGAPLIQVNSESDTGVIAQPDGPAYRLWEVAGAVHVDEDAQAYLRKLHQREFDKSTVEPQCTLRPFSQIPLKNAQAAAYEQLKTWAIDGTAPSSQPRFVYGADGSVEQDELGRPVGGVRLPELEVPVADNGVENTGTPLFCTQFAGHHIPYTATRLRALYPSRAGFLGQFEKATAAAVDAGVLLPADARASIATARAAALPLPAQAAPTPAPQRPAAPASAANRGTLPATGAAVMLPALGLLSVLIAAALRRCTSMH